MEHGLKDIAFYVQKHITPCTVVITSLLVRDKPLGVPASMKRVYSVTNRKLMDVSSTYNRSAQSAAFNSTMGK